MGRMNLQPDETTRKKGPARVVGYDLRQEIWVRFVDHNLSVDTLAKRLRVPKASVEDVLRGKLARRIA